MTAPAHECPEFMPPLRRPRIRLPAAKAALTYVVLDDHVLAVRESSLGANGSLALCYLP